MSKITPEQAIALDILKLLFAIEKKWDKLEQKLPHLKSERKLNANLVGNLNSVLGDYCASRLLWHKDFKSIKQVINYMEGR